MHDLEEEVQHVFKFKDIEEVEDEVGDLILNLGLY